MPKLRFAGYAAIFDKRDRGGDIIRPGAFRRSLVRRRDVPLLWQHQRGKVIGRIEMLEEDTRGLRVIARVEDQHVSAQLGRGRAGGLSFGYRVVSAGAPAQEYSSANRELLDLDLVEVSVVTVPMQPLARVHRIGN